MAVSVDGGYMRCANNGDTPMGMRAMRIAMEHTPIELNWKIVQVGNNSLPVIESYLWRKGERRILSHHFVLNHISIRETKT